MRTRVYEDHDCARAITAADLLVTYTCDVRPEESQQRMLVDFVTRGGRWLALHGTHSAIDPPEGEGPYRTPRVLGEVATLLGGQFLAHPPIEPYPVHVTAPGHPLVAGIEPFEVRDELYVLELRPPIEVLLHAEFTGECRSFEEGHVPDDEPRCSRDAFTGRSPGVMVRLTSIRIHLLAEVRLPPTVPTSPSTRRRAGRRRTSARSGAGPPR